MNWSDMRVFLAIARSGSLGELQNCWASATLRWGGVCRSWSKRAVSHFSSHRTGDGPD